MVGRRNAAGAVTNGGPNGTHEIDSVPPPSTLAAQLVRDHAPDTRRAANSATEFSQMLNEMMYNDVNPERDAHVNYNAILLVVRLGLEVLSKDDDPFAKHDALLSQARDSISVIEITIRRQPEILFFTQNDGQTAPMIIWLFARLVRASLHPKYRDLQSQVSTFLVSVVVILSCSLDYWQFAKTVTCLYRDSVEDILEPLQAQRRFTTKSINSVDVTLPPARSITRFSQSSGMTMTLPSDAQINLGSIMDACDVALTIIDASARLFTDHADQQDFAMSAWATQSLIVIQRTIDLNRDVLPSELDKAKSRLEQLTSTLKDGTMSVDPQYLIEPDDPNASGQALNGDLAEILAGLATLTSDIIAQPKISKQTYAKLEEQDQVQLWLFIAALLEEKAISQVSVKHIGGILVSLVDHSNLKNSTKCRIAAAQAIQSYARHPLTLDHMDLTSSTIGRWCVKGLTNSSREIRSTSARALVAFLRQDLSAGIRDRNRREALAIFRKLSSRSEPSQHETLIQTWGQVVLVCGDRERNLALLQLVEYLGHGSALISGLAACELEQVALSLSLEPERLMRPYWKSIAAAVARDLISVPQKAKLLSEFIGKTVEQFLYLIQAEVIPYLVLTKRKDVLQRIAAARAAAPDGVHARTNGSGGRAGHKGLTSISVQDIIMQPKSNLSNIMALLLCHVADGLDPEEYIAAVLCEFVPQWTEQDVASLIRLEPIPVVCEMLKTCGDEEDPGKKPKIYEAIQDFAVIIERKPHNARSRPAKLLGSFFEGHVLGIISHFSVTIERNDEHALLQEKVRCLKGIEDMITMATAHAEVAVPQIRACLQSAIDQGGLIDHALSAWLALMSNLTEENVVPLLGHLFSIVVQHWSSMCSDIQQKTYDIVAHLLKTYSDAIRDEVINVPSLAGIPLMSKFEAELNRLKSGEKPQRFLESFVHRLQDENASIVLQAGHELYDWLEQNQSFVYDGAVSEPPMPIVVTATRILLDTCVKYNNSSRVIADTCAKCLGVIGCLDPNRVEDNVTEPHMLVLSNFDQTREVCNWMAILFTDILVPAFKSASNARSQTFLAWAMQELLKFARFENVDAGRLRSSQTSTASEVWLKMPESTRNILLPFLSSSYVLNINPRQQQIEYPIFSLSMKHGEWVRRWAYDMLLRGKGDNSSALFNTLSRVILSHSNTIAKFLLPYAAANIVLGGTVKEVNEIGQEMLTILMTESKVPAEQEALRSCSEDVFAVLDYMTRWAQEKKRALALVRIQLQRAGHSPDEVEEQATLGQIASMEDLIKSIPPDVIAQRAIECGSYTRALFHWENFIRDERQRHALDASTRDEMYLRLQTIYSEIDEPDGLDGIAAQMNILTPEQEAWQHLQAGRWTAAQSWYEIELMNKPDDKDTQANLLLCLQQSGQASHVIRVAQDLAASVDADDGWRRRLLSFTSEAAWSTGCLKDYVSELGLLETPNVSNFNMSLGQILLDIDQGNLDTSVSKILALRSSISRTISSSTASSLGACHTAVLQLHVLREVEDIQQLRSNLIEGEADTSLLSATLEKRLAVLGTSIPDKQFVLGVRRAVLRATKAPVDAEIGKLWLTTARLARKADIDNAAHFAVIRASNCGDAASKIEHARLMWKNGQHRQAIHSLQGAIDSNIFAAYERSIATSTTSDNTSKHQNMLAARAHLLLAKWLDASGQTQTQAVTEKYQFAAKNYAKWEKGHYYLGKHYMKLLEAEKTLPSNKQSEAFHSGEITKLVIENYLRSVPFGSKYWYQTIPKLITLWLDLGMDCITKPRDLSQDMFDRRNKFLAHTHSQLKKYYDRVPRYVFYTALPQLISRISHPNAKVAEVLSLIITGIVSWHAQQGLWALLPVARATAQDRATRGREIIAKLRDSRSKSKSDTGGHEVRNLVIQGQKLQEALLNACDVQLEGRATNASLSRDLGFNHKLAPNPLVIPFQHNLTPNYPTVQDAGYIRNFKAFAADRVTIASFQDEVLVLNSLQRPRKLTLRGSDGKAYGLLCKPKDDLRKDQRLMEFNTMINRALKRSPESSRRRLYIKTYGVTPLSEESGAIEWVEGIKPLRDILLKLYSRRGISPNYTELRALLNEASSHVSNHHLFSRKILPAFPPVLHEWFTELFPSPSSWFASRLRYTRTAAVMSMVGHVLGLGDRHGENILLEESNGGVFHVDFNCLFDKGLTFEKPELVPFRLTHNMTDAMGPVLGVEGPFRKSAELTLRLLREEQDTLMNILETFLHDPTTDFVGRRKRSGTSGAPETPREVLDSVSGKLRGYLRGESVPLSVEGMVQALIEMARDEGNLCRIPSKTRIDVDGIEMAKDSMIHAAVTAAEVMST
ncbi:Phosphatidylinositol -3 and 4-kinase-like protein [Elsinoe fawcettii]|nr:Phosphatidylinositol -3 and 4-kinase-like protein [Elsinoe fawcettii]